MSHPVALAGRLGAHLGFSIDPCAQLGAETIGRPFDGEGMTLCGQECRGEWILVVRQPVRMAGVRKKRSSGGVANECKATRWQPANVRVPSVLIDKYMRFSAGVSAEDFGGGQDGCCDRLDAERAART